MILVWTKTASGGYAVQKWRMKPSDLTSGYFKDLIVKQVTLPIDEMDLSITELRGKYGDPTDDR